MFDLGETGFNVIFLRNSILTYLKDDLKRVGFRKVIHNLAAGGFLVIGSHEKLPCESPLRVPVANRTYLFKKVEIHG
jgi:chemotaxis methyl-accepting protein methylase